MDKYNMAVLGIEPDHIAALRRDILNEELYGQTVVCMNPSSGREQLLRGCNERLTKLRFDLLLADFAWREERSMIIAEMQGKFDTTPLDEFEF